MSEHLPAIIALSIFVVPPLLACGLALYVGRRKPDDITTGDPMNPDALTQWRKANKARFQ